MFKNAIWNDPIRWTEKTIGSKTKFISVLFMQFFLFVVTVLVYSRLTYKLYGHIDFYPLFVFVFTGMVLMPFAYLIALRKMLIELKKTIPNQKGKL